MDTVYICGQSKQHTFNKAVHHFFKRLTTLNDSKIDKDLLLSKNVPSNTWP